MGTFHQGKHRFHGMTLVVDTTGPKVYIGRCDDLDDEWIVLVDVETHDEGTAGLGKEEYIRKAARVGYEGVHRRMILSAREVQSIRLLGEIPVS
ncbi:MAG: hypothetical protein ABIK65_13960 [Candidatus Eisenbacteria bacterium]